MVTLQCVDGYPHLLELKLEHVQLDRDVGDNDAVARHKLAMVGSGHAPRNAPKPQARELELPEFSTRNDNDNMMTAGAINGTVARARVSRNAPGTSRWVMSWIWTRRLCMIVSCAHCI